MDASTEMDALLRAVRERQQSTLEATIDVGARLSSFKANLDTGWWAELETHREALVATAAQALSRSLRRTAENQGTARRLVDTAYQDALENLSELVRLAPSNRRRWLLNRTLEQVLEIVQGRAGTSIARFTKRA